MIAASPIDSPSFLVSKPVLGFRDLAEKYVTKNPVSRECMIMSLIAFEHTKNDVRSTHILLACFSNHFPQNSASACLFIATVSDP